MEVAMASPDVDRLIRYVPRWQRREGIARLRVFHSERLALVTELADNPGMSVTNAIEAVGDVVEALLGVRFAAHPTLMVDVTWSLVEHYERPDPTEDSLSVVTFAGRDGEGLLEGPTWRYVQAGELAWLDAALMS